MKNLAKIFKDTRKKSQTLYESDTKNLLVNTYIYDDADNIISDNDMILRDHMNIKVVSGGTVSTAYKIKEDSNRVALLNFADAKRPGGWVVEGAQTQEENICRCTNLYETLVQQKCIDDYYSVNLSFGIPDAEKHYCETYTNTMIYAEDVAIFKDDKNYFDIPVKYADVITCPAPCGYFKGVENILMHRMCGIVKAAYMHKVTHIVLGAWGCGAFGQNPKVVAECFKTVLNKYPVFDSVIFAVRTCAVDLVNKTTNNYFIFKDILS